MAKKVDTQTGWEKTFSHREAAAVSGLTPDALLLYNKRGLLPEADFPAVAVGTGNRRRYTVEQAVVLALARVLIEAGVPVVDSMWLASRLDLQKTKKRAGTSAGMTPPADVIRRMLVVAVARSKAEGYSREDVLRRLREDDRPLTAVFKADPAADIRGYGFQTKSGYSMMELSGAETQAQIVLGMRAKSITWLTLVDLAQIAATVFERAFAQN